MTDIDPRIWGPKFWSTYHIYASSYPINPTPIVMDAARAFIKIIPYTLPCTWNCSDHAFAYIQNTLKSDPELSHIIATRATMEQFFFNFHNNVNYRLGKRLVTELEARKIWSF
jgi:hypothetical protein